MRIISGVFALFLIAVVLADEDEVIVESIDELPEDLSPTSNSDSEFTYVTPELDLSNVNFFEHFDDETEFNKKWIKSEATKEGTSEEIAKYDGEWQVERPSRDALAGDQGLVLKTQAKHAAISAYLDKPFLFVHLPLIVQYEVTLQDGQQCGGAYLKLLHGPKKSEDLKNFHDKTPYTIMFGPDKCGGDYKLHFIFNYKNPLNGSYEEKHCKKPSERLEDLINDKRPHLYKLVLRPDNTFSIYVDMKLVNEGSLFEDFTPAVNPPLEIEDPEDKKPEDWDDREKIPDPQAVKPEDWDDEAPAQIIDETATMPDGWLENEPAYIKDPTAQVPPDWDAEIDGEWEAPLIDNPACVEAPGCGSWEPPLMNNPNYQGKWKAPMIENPNYKGKWRARSIPNPEYFKESNPFSKLDTVTSIGFELWSMSKDILFDNILITHDESLAYELGAKTYEIKMQKINKDSESLLEKLAKLTVDYPILWALYIVVLGIPVVFVLYLCFKPSSKDSPNTEEINDLQVEAEKKKTDEETKDVIADEDENLEDDIAENNDEEEVNNQNSEETTRKRKVRKE